MEVGGRVETIQMTALPRTARILRRVLETYCYSDSSEKPSANTDVKNSKGVNNNNDNKCAMLIMKGGKRHMMEGIELPNQEKIRTIRENETYKFLGILEADTIKQVEMKEKLKKKRISQENEITTRKQTALQKSGAPLVV